MRGCIARNCGTILAMTKPTAPAKTGTLTSNRRDSGKSSRSAMTMPPTHMMGEVTSMLAPISTSI